MLQQCSVPRKVFVGKIIPLGVMEDEKILSTVPKFYVGKHISYLPKLQHFFN